MVRSALVVLFLLFSSTVYAETSCGPQDYEQDVEPDFSCPGPGESDLTPNITAPSSVSVAEGDEVLVPWDGALVHRDRLILLGLKLQAARRVRWLDRLVSRRTAKIETEYQNDLSLAGQGLCDARIDHYRDLATAATGVAERAEVWYRSFGFGLVVGFVTSGLLVALAVYFGLTS